MVFSRPSFFRLQAARRITAAGFGLCAAISAAPQVTNNDIPRDNLKARWANYETHPIQPILFSPGRQFFYALNTGGSRVALLATNSLNPLLEIPTGPGLSSMELTPNGRELWYTDRVASTVGVIQVGTGRTIRSIRVGAEPHGIVFSANGDRAYVACSGVDRVDVIRTTTYDVVNSISIPARNPRAIVRLGNKVYVAPFMSGNGTATRGANGNHRVNDPIEVRRVDDFQNATPLPDRDLLAITVGPAPETDTLDAAGTLTGLGTMLFNMHQRPGTTELWIPHTEALNATHAGEVNFVDGQVVKNRITIVDPVVGGAPTFVDLDVLAPSTEDNCAAPTGIAFTSDGSRAFVCGYGSDRVAVLDVSPGNVSWAGVIRIQPFNGYPNGSGPRAAAVSPNDQRLIVFNKVSGNFTAVDLDDLPSTPSFVFDASPAQSLGFNPLPPRIRNGRMHHNRTQHSGLNTSSCFQCHVDGHTDGLVWDLSAYLDPEGTPNDQLSYPIDQKGPMVTQSGRRLREVGPYHWRGEVKKLRKFDIAFLNLLEREVNGQPTPLGSDFVYIVEYFEHLSMLPNPRADLDRNYNQEQLEGADLFLNKPVLDQLACVDCHTLPLGTMGEMAAAEGGASLSPFAVVPQLRGVADKLSPPFQIGGDFGTRTELGAGLAHGGTFASIEDLLSQPLPPPQAGQLFDLSPTEVDKVTAFLEAFDTGLAPSTGFQATAHSGNAASVEAGELAYLIAEAEAGNCDVVFRKGPQRHQGVWRYFTGVYVPGSGWFKQASSGLPNLLPSELIAEASSGKPVTFVGVPLHMGWTMGVDRDNDKLLDVDEVLLGTDAQDPDTDGDGFPDGYERAWQMNALVADISSPDTVAPGLLEGPTTIYKTMHALKFDIVADEPVRVLVSYDGGNPVLRQPFENRFDDRFSLVLDLLDPSTSYDVNVSMEDAAGNLTDVGFTVRTRDRLLPTPVHIEDIALEIIDNLPPTDNQLRATLQLLEGDKPAQAANYVLHGRLYHATGTGVVTEIDTSGQVWASGLGGIAVITVDIPPSIPLGRGDLHLVIDSVDAPPNEPTHMRPDDVENHDLIPY